MAKKNKIVIDVEVDDKGSTKKVGLGAKKASKDLDGVANSSRNAQKGIKGVAQTASAGGKNFAGMSRGMGGLVGAYAAFAAQMFALTAAFGFFKRAGDLAVMQAGQTAYASATGVAMKSLANDIIAATSAQITFRDASQAAAIGTAAGLSADQLVRLGTAAKDASAVLGRDVTDAFNRLVRGVTKAEPELLDELGIILRLDTASENYARSLGIAAKDLTQFQKSQAVANEVLDQTEDKYSAILAVTGGSQANEFAKVGKAMDDVVMTIQTALLPAANAVAKVLTDMPLLAGAGFALLAAGPLKAMGFSMKDIGRQAQINAAINSAAHKKRKIELLDTTRAIQLQKTAIQEKARATMMDKNYTGGSKTIQNIANTGIITPQARANIEKGFKALDLTVDKHTKVVKGMFKGMTVGAVLEYQTMIVRMTELEKQKELGTAAWTTRMKVHIMGIGAAMKSFGAGLLAVGAGLMSFIGWAALAVTIVLSLKEAFSDKTPLTLAQKQMEDTGKKLKDLVKEYEHFIEVQRIMAKEQTGAQGIAMGAATGKMIGALSPKQTLDFLKLNDSYAKKNKKMLYEEKKAYFEATVAAEGLWSVKASMAQDDLIKSSGRKFEGTIGRMVFGSFFDAEGAITDEEIAASKTKVKQLEGIKQLEDQFGGSKAFSDYRSILGPDSKATEDDILNIKMALEDYVNTLSTMPQVMKDAADASTSFWMSFAPMNDAEKAISKHQVAVAAAQAVIDNYEPSIAEKLAAKMGMPAINPVQLKARQDITAGNAEITRIDKVNEAQAKRVSLLKEAQLVLKKAESVEHPIYKKREMALAQETVATVTLANKISEIALLKEIVSEFDKNSTNVADRSQRRKLKALEDEKSSLEEIERQAKRKVELNTQLFALEKGIFDLKTNQKLVNTYKTLLEYDKQSLDIAKRKAAIETAQANRKIDKEIDSQAGRGGLLGDEAGIRAGLEAKAARKALDEPGGVKDKITEEFKQKKAIIAVENTLMTMKFLLLDMEMKKLKLERETIRSAALIAAAKEKDPVVKQDLLDQANELGSVMFGDQVMDKILSKISSVLATLPEDQKALLNLVGLEEVEALAAAVGYVEDLELKAKNLTSIEVHMKELGETIRGSMEGAFTAMVTGAKSAKAAFADMAMSILSQMAQMLVQMMLLQMFQGSTFGTFLGMGKGRTGGVFNQGQKIQGYATGGVARGSTSGYPTMLHGTEAVVPLPNGRSIPVEMKDSGGTNNNIVVNISTDGQSSKEGSSGPDMDKLGGAIATAVQVELQNQKRSGGILNPYGVA